MKLILLAGVPGVGKSWIGKQLSSKFLYIPHDDYIGLGFGTLSYLDALEDAVRVSTNIVVGETPFSVSRFVDHFYRVGLTDIEIVYVIEDEETLKYRYSSRTGKEIPEGHLTRQRTYLQRAKDAGAFYGTSTQCLKYLEGV
jgi:2-phosphoglycerate kinase